MKIKHIAIKVSDMDAAADFYINALGLEHVNTVMREGKNGNHISKHLTDGYMDLTLIQYENESADEADLAGPAPCIHHIGLECEDLDGTVKDIVAKGAEIVSRDNHLPVKFRTPGGPIAEVVPMQRWEKETLADGVHGKVLA